MYVHLGLFAKQYNTTIASKDEDVQVSYFKINAQKKH